MKVLFLLLQILIGCFYYPGPADSLSYQKDMDNKPNKDVYELLITGIIDSTLKKLQITKENTFVVPPSNGQSEIDIFINNVILLYLSENNYHVSTSEKGISEDSKFVIIKSNIDKFSINYIPFSKKEINRFISITIWMNIYSGPGRKVLSAGKISKGYSDIISKRSIDYLEKDIYKFTKGKYNYSPKWKKFIEPALVGTVVSGIIYSFFHFRTK